MDLLARMNDLFREVFDDESLVITPETTADDVEGWDSLSHVNLILAVETRFGVKFSKNELSMMRNVGDLLAAVALPRPD